MFTIRASRRAPKLLLLLTVVATAVVFLAPTAQAAAGLSLDKSASPAEGSSVSPGDVLTYTVVVANAGPDAATGLTFTDPVPAGTTYVADSASVNLVQVPGASNPFATPYSLPDLAASASHTLAFQVTVDSPLPNGTVITNTASASSPDDPASPLQDQTAHTVASTPSLTLSKTALPAEGGSVAPGDALTYTLVVGNAASASDTATGVSVTDALPANTTYVADSATENGSPVAGATNPFETGYTLADSSLSPGEQHTLTFDVLVNSPLPNGTVISNSATASAANAADASDGATHSVASAPGLAVDKSASPAEGGPVAPGGTITYTVQVSNDPLATGSATGVSLTDAVPANTTYVADSATVDALPVPGASNPFESGYALPDMAPGDTHTVSFQVLVDPVLDNGTSITNSAVVDSDQGSVTDDAVHTVQSQSNLSLVKSASPAEGGPVTPGTTITYSLLVTNDAAANEVAAGLVLTDPTPAGTKYVAGSATIDGAPVDGEENPLAAGLDLPDLAPGESATVTYAVTVDSPLANGTVVSNLARLTADNHPDLEDDATHTVDSTAVMKVAVVASPVAGSAVEPGATIQYTVTVSNDAAATESVTGVNVTETPPAGATQVPPGPPATARLDAASAGADAASPSALGEQVLPLEGGTPHELVNQFWGAVAEGKDPTLIVEALFGTGIGVDDQLAPGLPPPHSGLFMYMTPEQLAAFLLKHPEASQVIQATLGEYPALRASYLYMLEDYKDEIFGRNPAASTGGIIGFSVVGGGLPGAPMYTAREAAEMNAALADANLSPEQLKALGERIAAQALARGSADGPTTSVTDEAALRAASGAASEAAPLGDIAPGTSRTVTFAVRLSPSATGVTTNTVTVSATNHPVVVTTTTHMAPSAEEDEDGGREGNGRALGPPGGGSTTTALGSTSSGVAGESLAFTGLDLAKLVLLAMSLLLAGWVLLSRGRALQTRAQIVSARRPAYEVPSDRYAPRTWFFLPTGE